MRTKKHGSQTAVKATVTTIATVAAPPTSSTETVLHRTQREAREKKPIHRSNKGIARCERTHAHTHNIHCDSQIEAHNIL